jgi:hypothetical protein
MNPPYPRVWLGDKDIVFVEFAPHSQITLQLIQQVCQKRFELIKRPSAIIIIAKKVSGYDIDATLHLSHEAIKNSNLAYAIITESFLTDFTAREFIKYHKPPCPVQIFDSEQDAVEWLSHLNEED